MEESLLASACSQFSNRTLFYPSAGSDFKEPIKTFMPWIDEFWFVDVNYDEKCPRLADVGFRLISSSYFELTGRTISLDYPFRIPVSSQQYLHVPSGREFTANFCRGRGYDAFRSAFRVPQRPLSVFFYRGDSQGEGGSGFMWLKRRTARYIVDQLDSHSVLVSDGSNAMPELSKFHCNQDIGASAVEESEEFGFRGKQFSCIGYLGERYGPTLVWKLSPIVNGST